VDFGVFSNISETPQDRTNVTVEDLFYCTGSPRNVGRNVDMTRCLFIVLHSNLL